MIRRLLMLLALGSQLVALSAQTAKTRANLYTQIDSSLPSNSSGAITAATLRTVFKDTIASAYNQSTDGSAWLMPTFTASTISTGQSGLGWDENGRVTLQTPVGALQFYTTGSPSESVIYWPGRIITNSIDAGTISGTLPADRINAPLGSETINATILSRSLVPPIDKWQMGQTYAGTAGITYVADTDMGDSEFEPTVGVYFPQANVTSGGTVSINQIAGRYRTSTQVKSDLAIAATDLTATGTKDSTTYLRGDNTWATVSGGAVTSVAGRTGAVTLTTADVSGLGGSALLNVGTTAGTVAAGNDSRIAGALSTTTAASTYQPLNTVLSQLSANDGSAGLYLNGITSAGGINGDGGWQIDSGGTLTGVSMSAALLTGTINIARLPTGTTSTTLALGNAPAAAQTAAIAAAATDATTKANAAVATANAFTTQSISGRVTFSKANYTVPDSAVYVAQIGVFVPVTDVGGARTVTLPSAASYGVGKELTIADESYSLRPWFRLMITPASGQTINGQTNGTYPMVWAGQTVSLLCTGAGWQVVACNIVPAPYVAENPNHGRGNICVETDFGDYQSGSFSAGGRIQGSSSALVSHASSFPTTVMRAIALAAGGGTAGNGCRLVTTSGPAAQETRSRKTGEWCEWIVAGVEASDATNNSVQEWGITSYENTPAVNQTADPIDGVVIRFERAVNATNLIAVSSGGGVRTAVDTGIAYSTLGAAPTRIGIQIGDGTGTCHVYVNDTLAATLTTNLPATTSFISPTAMTRWVAGVNRNMFIDRLRYQFRVADVATRLY